MSDAIVAPPGYEDLPNPRGFTPVPLPDFPLIPDPFMSPLPVDAPAWPIGRAFSMEIPLPDGVTLRGSVCLPTEEPAPFVALLHMWGMDHASWERRAPAFLADLTARGFAWIAYDLRWHGESEGEPHCATYGEWLAARQMPPGDDRVQRMQRLARRGPPLGANLRFLPDLGHVLNFMRASGRVQPDNYALLGASVGANAVWVASALYQARTHICISPYYPTPGWTLMGREVPDFAPRDCLFVADREEWAEVSLMLPLTTNSRLIGSRAIKEHGVGLLRQEGIRAEVLGHLASAFR